MDLMWHPRENLTELQAAPSLQVGHVQKLTHTRMFGTWTHSLKSLLDLGDRVPSQPPKSTYYVQSLCLTG